MISATYDLNCGCFGNFGIGLYVDPITLALKNRRASIVCEHKINLNKLPPSLLLGNMGVYETKYNINLNEDKRK